MATPLNITPLRAAKARDLFVHSAISRSFTQLNTALAHYVECERDIEHADSFAIMRGGHIDVAALRRIADFI